MSLYKAFDYAVRTSRKKFIHDYNAMNYEILQAYLNAGNNLVEKLTSSNSPKDLALLRGYAKAIHDQVEDIIESYGLKSALTPLDYERIMLLEFLADRQAPASEFGKELEKVINLHSRQGAEMVFKGKLYKDNRNLSSRIWSSSNGSAQSIQQVVAMAEAQGMSAAELSTLLEDFVNPSKRKLWTNEKLKEKLGDGYARAWKDLEYNALRLARTTISHIGTESVKLKQKVNPFAKKVQWHSVHAQGRTCQTCIEMDGNIYDINEVPFDHPNGLCYQTVYFEQSLEEMADRLAGWVNDPSSDPELEEWWAERNTIPELIASFVKQ